MFQTKEPRLLLDEVFGKDSHELPNMEELFQSITSAIETADDENGGSRLTLSVSGCKTFEAEFSDSNNTSQEETFLEIERIMLEAERHGHEVKLKMEAI